MLKYVRQEDQKRGTKVKLRWVKLNQKEKFEKETQEEFNRNKKLSREIREETQRIYGENKKV